MFAITRDFKVTEDEPGTKDLNDERGEVGVTTGHEPPWSRCFYESSGFEILMERKDKGLSCSK